MSKQILCETGSHFYRITLTIHCSITKSGT